MRLQPSQLYSYFIGHCRGDSVAMATLLLLLLLQD